MLRAIKLPNKYEPLSPKKILALGKLKSKKEISIIIWPVKKNENSRCSFLRFIYSKIELIIIKCIVKSPLKPSIRFAPFIINKKHKTIKKIEKILFSNQRLRNSKSTFSILIEKILMNITRETAINKSLRLGLILIFISSMYPIKNKLIPVKKYT